jgi:hypothetical protein
MQGGTLAVSLCFFFQAIVHGVFVILSAAKNLVCAAIPREILRCAQNDGVFSTPERCPLTVCRENLVKSFQILHYLGVEQRLVV